MAAIFVAVFKYPILVFPSTCGVGEFRKHRLSCVVTSGVADCTSSDLRLWELSATNSETVSGRGYDEQVPASELVEDRHSLLHYGTALHDLWLHRALCGPRRGGDDESRLESWMIKLGLYQRRYTRRDCRLVCIDWVA